MPIDWNAIEAAGGFGKGPTKATAKETRDNERKGADEKENVKVKARSGGRCEIKSFPRSTRRITRCERRAAPGVHHMIGGIGRRARGPSLLAKHKQDVCNECHQLITSHRLRRIGGDLPLFTDEYERVDR